jgi:flagellar biosynthetic protein FliR
MLFAIDTMQILTAALVFFRIGAMFSVLPIFGDEGVPVRARILLSAAIAFAVFPTVPTDWAASLVRSTSGVYTLGLMICREMLVGIVIGYIAKVAFEGVVMAATVVGFQMGFDTQSVILPGSESHTSGYAAVHRLIIVLIFLSLDLHHVYIQTIRESFNVIDLGSAYLSAPLAQILINVSSNVFITALQLAAPTLVGLLLTTAGLGLISRAVPQANVFILSFPTNFYVGLFIYIAMLPLLPGWTKAYFSAGHEEMLLALRALKN